MSPNPNHPYRPVVDLSKSPFAVMHPISLDKVRLNDRFLEPRIQINRTVTIPSQLEHCEKTGRLNNFRRASGKIEGDFVGIFFNDSDIYKWAEAAAFSLAATPDKELEQKLDNVIEEIWDAQQTDGYINTYFMFEREGERFTNLKDKHEIYCAGHLIQAAVAHHRATGRRNFLDIACRLAECLYHRFGTEHEIGACGHQVAEMALVELYRETRLHRFLELAICMVEARGQKPPVISGEEYHQDHLPFIETTEVVGHAVRQLYYTSGAADILAETGDSAYRNALEKLWDNFTQRRMYVTGGAGSRYEGEAFGKDYELPNGRAYTETCAAIASLMWNWRMLHITGEAKFADLMETTLYNAILPGISLDGTTYFYENPLSDRGNHRRSEWFGCACCPPNIARTIASLTGYFYSTDKEGNIFAHLYAAGEAEIALPEGSLNLRQRCEYPWDGKIVLEVSELKGTVGRLKLRIPAWANVRKTKLTLRNGESITEVLLKEGGYVSVPIENGTVVTLSLPMEVQVQESHPHVLNNRDRVALRRGPIVYCLEQEDNPDADVWDICLADSTQFTTRWEPDLLGGVMTIKAEALALDSLHWEDTLYAPHRSAKESSYYPASVTAIPYFAWANRDPGAMVVWIPMVGGI